MHELVIIIAYSAMSYLLSVLSYARIEGKVDFCEHFFSVHVSIEDLYTLGVSLAESPCFV